MWHADDDSSSRSSFFFQPQQVCRSDVNVAYNPSALPVGQGTRGGTQSFAQQNNFTKPPQYPPRYLEPATLPTQAHVPHMPQTMHFNQQRQVTPSTDDVFPMGTFQPNSQLPRHSPLRPHRQSQMALSKLTAPLNLSNVEDRMEQFAEEERKLQRAYEKLKRRKQEAFQKEMREFEEAFDPFAVLGIDPTDDLNIIRKAYKKQSLRHHPDKGGSERKFTLVTKAYFYVTKKQEQHNRKTHYTEATAEDLRQQARSFMEQQDAAPAQNILLDKDRFDLTTFNKIFDQNRLSDPDDEGYGEWIGPATQREETFDVPKMFNGQFNRDVFNDTFEKDKSTSAEKDLIVFEEPQALICCNLGFKQLGSGRTDNYGDTSTYSNSYSDYKMAHTTHSRLIDPTQVQYKQYHTVEELERDRANISFDLSAHDRKRMELQRARQELEEEERLMRLSTFDQEVEQTHNRLNKLLIRS